MSVKRSEGVGAARALIARFEAQDTPRGLLWLTALVGCAGTLLLEFPGQLNADSLTQYSEAVSGKYTDWHPPIMAALWHLILPVVGGPVSLLTIQVALHWLAFALIADGLHQSGRKALGFFVLVSAASPLFLFYLGRIHKDFQLASAFLASFALVFNFRVRGRGVPPVVLVMSLVLWAYGVLVRTNGAFAGAPLLLYLIAPRSKFSVPATLAASSVAVLMILPLSFAFNRVALRAQPTGVAQTLQMFDIAGTAFNSGDSTRFDAVTTGFTPSLRGCYTPLFWDALSKDRCNELWFRLPPPDSARRAAITEAWFGSIVHHPFAYAAHRLKHFNMSLNFMTVPAQQCSAAPEIHDCGTLVDGKMSDSSKHHVYLMDYLKKNVFYWPVVWLVIGAGLIIPVSNGRTSTSNAGFYLIASGLLYSLAYLIVGVAADPRYHYWSILAIQTGVIVSLAEFSWPGWKRPVLLTSVALVTTVALGYGFRIAEIHLFIR